MSKVRERAKRDNSVVTTIVLLAGVKAIEKATLSSGLKKEVDKVDMDDGAIAALLKETIERKLGEK